MACGTAEVRIPKDFWGFGPHRLTSGTRIPGAPELSAGLKKSKYKMQCNRGLDVPELVGSEAFLGQTPMSFCATSLPAKAVDISLVRRGKAQPTNMFAGMEGLRSTAMLGHVVSGLDNTRPQKPILAATGFPVGPQGHLRAELGCADPEVQEVPAPKAAGSGALGSQG